MSVSEWLQGSATGFDRLSGKVVLVEVFQINCPGCFIYSLPNAIELYERYGEKGLVVLGIATAFEDFDKNTVENLRLLLEMGEVIGETKRVLSLFGRLREGRWPFRIPFPVAVDKLTKMDKPVSEQYVNDFIREQLPDISGYSKDYQQRLRQRVFDYLQSLEYRAETFERFQLQGTPSQILVDRQGVLRACRFGEFPELEDVILQYLD
ncbi:MAG: TlpA family protein disulfide reductase [Gammaproteobacteria bacterium]